MKQVFRFFFLFVMIVTAIMEHAMAQSPGKSQWVYPGSDGKLVYKTLPAGDKIMDFSYAGYMGGGVKIPEVDVKITLGPVAGDNSTAIQNAIDEVSKKK